MANKDACLLACSCTSFNTLFLSPFWLVAVLPVAVLVCRRFGHGNLSPFWCRRFGVSPFWFVAVLTIPPSALLAIAISRTIQVHRPARAVPPERPVQVPWQSVILTTCSSTARQRYSTALTGNNTCKKNNFALLTTYNGDKTHLKQQK